MRVFVPVWFMLSLPRFSQFSEPGAPRLRDVFRQLLALGASNFGEQHHWNLASIPLATALNTAAKRSWEPGGLNIRTYTESVNPPSDHAPGAGIVPPIHPVSAVAC